MVRTVFSPRRAAAAGALAGLVALTVAGCGSSGSSASSEAGSGQLTVLLADAPPDLGNVEAVNVTISRVQVHRSSGGTGATVQQASLPPQAGSPASGGREEANAAEPEGDGAWETVFEGSRTFNLLDLANVTDVTTLPHLVEDGLPAGHYDQLRLIVASGEIVVDGQTHPLFIPSGSETGLKTQAFDVASKQDTVLLLDFDVAQSVHRTGNGQYMLQPVIRLAPVTLAGSIVGTVVDAAGAPMSAQVTLKDAAGAVVTTSITTVDDAEAAKNGVFALHALPSGTYTLEVAAEGYTTVTSPVTVTAPNVTNAGSVTLSASSGG